jgi:hypothetical protein
VAADISQGLFQGLQDRGKAETCRGIERRQSFVDTLDFSCDSRDLPQRSAENRQDFIDSDETPGSLRGPRRKRTPVNVFHADTVSDGAGEVMVTLSDLRLRMIGSASSAIMASTS